MAATLFSRARAPSSGARWRVMRSRPIVASTCIVGLLAFGGGVGVQRHALWQVVRACVANYQSTGSSFPCLAVDLADGIDDGVVVLRPPFGEPDTILAPTRKVVGVEDPWLQSPSAPNYFAAALQARAFVKKPDGSSPRLDEVALAVNSRFTRTQDQLHIHVGCESRRVRRALADLAPDMQVGEWRRLDSLFPGSQIWVMRTGRSDLGDVAPFRLAAERLAAGLPDLDRLMISVLGTRIANRDELLLLVADYRRQAPRARFLAEEVVDLACAESGAASPRP